MRVPSATSDASWTSTLAPVSSAGCKKRVRSVGAGEVTHTLQSGGFTADAARQALDSLAQSQSVMLATNEIMAFVALAFFASALLIWLAPRPTRKVEMGAAH